MTSRFVQKVIPFLGIAFFAVAILVLYRELQALTYEELAGTLRLFPRDQLLLGVGVTAASYMVLTLHDFLGLRYVGRRLPYRQSGMASFVGYSFSNTLGFTLVTGAPLRYRLYTAWGLSTVDVTRVVAFYTTTFWLSLFVLGGGLLVLLPGAFPDLLPLPAGWARAGGGVLLALPVAYLAWAVKIRRPVRFRSLEFPPPNPGLAGMQLLLGVVDWILAGAVLYVLLPVGHGLPFPAFMAVYLAAVMAGLASHVPGGLGVFEAVFFLALPAAVPEESLLATLVVWRGVYFVIPLLAASALLGGYEAIRSRERVEKAVGTLGRGLSSAAPHLLSGAVFLSGAFLLLSGAVPLPDGRLATLGRLLPLPLLELSHFLASLAGAGLLVVAWGLRRRVDAAYHLTLVLLGAGAVLALIRGPGLLPAVAAGLVFLLLLPARREFFRRTPLTSEPLSPQWTALVALALLATLALGLFAFRHVEYSSDLWWRFSLMGDAPRFLRATVGAGAVLLLFAAVRLLRPIPPPEAEPGELPPEVPATVATSPRASAHLALVGDKAFLLSRSRRSFVMYGVEGRSWISMGDPVGDEEEFSDLVWRFRKTVFRSGGWPVFYQVRPRHLPLYLDAGLTFLKLGEEAKIPLDEFSLEGKARRGFRKTLSQGEREGAAFEILPPEGVPETLPALREISDAWLAEKRTREKGFSVGSFSEDYLSRTPVAVIRREGEIEAFLNIWASGDREELSGDLMRFRPEAPRSVMEYLFVNLILWGKDEGYRTFSLGMAPLSGLDARPLAPLWSRVGSALFRHGEHFYNFQGVRAYKEKFDPVWEPRYLASPGGLALPRILSNVAALISRGIVGIGRR